MPADEFGADRRRADCVEVLRLVRITLEMRIEGHYRRTASEEEVDLTKLLTTPETPHSRG
jgi:hypothetical protein